MAKFIFFLPLVVGVHAWALCHSVSLITLLITSIFSELSTARLVFNICSMIMINGITYINYIPALTKNFDKFWRVSI